MGRRCHDASPEHAGLHEHLGELWYNPQGWEAEAAAIGFQRQGEEESDDEHDDETSTAALESIMRNVSVEEGVWTKRCS